MKITSNNSCINFYKDTVILFRCALFIALLFCFYPAARVSLHAEVSKSNGNSEIDKKTQPDSFENSKFVFKSNGFIEIEDFLSTYTRQETSTINKKSEVRTNLKIKYGTDSFYLVSNSNLYFAPVFIDDSINETYIYSGKPEIGRNGRLSNKYTELDFRELYFNFGFSNFRLRAGNQIFGWGTADVFNPTSYFNPYDLREFLFRDDDELRVGIPALSAMFFLNNYTLEFVFTPLHVPLRLADQGNFWAIRYKEGPFPVFVDEAEELEIAPENFAYGARLSRSTVGVDLSLSIFHGPDRDPVFRPLKTEITFPYPSIIVSPEHHVVTMVGADFSTDLDRFVLQGEVSYTHDKVGVVDQEYSILTKFPFDVKHSHFLSYSAGLNYFIPINRLFENHEGETILTLEWYQSRYFDSSIQEPFITDLLTVKIQDSFFSSRLHLMVSCIIDVSENGLIIWPKAEYDFQNGLKISVQYADIRGNEGSIFKYFENNDLVMLKVHYVF